MSFFADQLNLTDLFGGPWLNFSMNYETSSLIYRICFPIWEGLQIQHAPLYIGYILNNPKTTMPNDSHLSTSTPTNNEPWSASLIIATSAITIVVSASLLLYLKKRKKSVE